MGLQQVCFQQVHQGTYIEESNCIHLQMSLQITRSKIGLHRATHAVYVIMYILPECIYALLVQCNKAHMQVKSDHQWACASLQSIACSPVASDLAVAGWQTRGWRGHERSIALCKVLLQSTVQHKYWSPDCIPDHTAKHGGHQWVVLCFSLKQI